MPLPTLYEICIPRPDVLEGSIAESDFAADLARVLRNDAPPEYLDPVKFFANTHPTRGLKSLLWNICQRINGRSGQVSSIFRLDTNYGGGKTHSLIALVHAATGMPGVRNVEEFIDPGLLPKGKVRIAAFDGENADPTNGRNLGNGVRAFTPWGEIAYALAGKEGYDLVRKSDVEGVAPGADTIRELFGREPTLVLIDELSVYLRKLKAKDWERAGGQLTAFLTALFKAVESTRNAALVYTLAIGKGGLATDAYSDENQFIAEKMDEAEKVSARKATLLDPTEEDETVRILRRRLFSEIDDRKAGEVINAYKHLWDLHKENLPSFGNVESQLEAFRNGFPLHPELIETLKEKTATLGNFQRVRGMLRLLARTVSRLWEKKPSDASAVHLHHADLGFEPIRQEIVTRLNLRQFVPAIKADVAAVEGDQPSLAEEIDSQYYVGLPPYGSYIARTIFFHTLAFNESLKGVSLDHLRYSVVSPGTDISFIDDAVRRFVQTSAYLDDRPNVPLRFLTEANLTQMIQRQEKNIDPGEVRAQLNDRIKSVFSGKVFETVAFPSIPNDLPDEVGEGKPILALINYDAAEADGDRLILPELVRKLYREKGSSGEPRLNRNNVVFVVVDTHRKPEMRRKMRRRLALEDLRQPERIRELAEHQRDRLLELHKRSEQELALVIQQAYRHVFYPSTSRVEGADVSLGHTVITVQSASADPGDGQKQIVRFLRDVNKLRLPEDSPDSPTYICDRTPLKKGQISTAALRNEFRRDPALPILLGNDVFLKGIRQGIENGHFVYRSGDLLWGQGDPWADIKIDEQSFVLTTSFAKEHEIWPKRKEEPRPEIKDKKPEAGVGSGTEPGKVPTGTTPPPLGNQISHEGVLKEALTRIWEEARSRKFSRITTLICKMYDSVDGFKMLGLVGTVPKAEKAVLFDGSYETPDGSELEVRFEGSVKDAMPVKDFLDPQLRAAKDKVMTVSFTITFAEGLELKGDEPEKVSDKLSKFGVGAAYVTAIAEGN